MLRVYWDLKTGLDHKLSMELNEAVPRPLLPNFSTVEHVVEAIRSARRIVVLTGAGISVSCGIPDFRSSNGIYEMVERMGIDLDDPQCLFDMEFFRDNPQPFYDFAHLLYPKGISPSTTHKFLVQLHEKKKLLRTFTQNIDGLEIEAGLPEEKLVACHGTLHRASCIECGLTVHASSIQQNIDTALIARCSKCGGVMKPCVTFFGESLGNSVKKALSSDRNKADLLLVIGTSLKVMPMSHVVSYLPAHVPQVLINKETVEPPASLSQGFDVQLLGQCDDVVSYMTQQLGWSQFQSPVKQVRHPISFEERYWQFVAAEMIMVKGKAGTVADDEGHGTKDKRKRRRKQQRAAMPEYEEVVTCDACNKTIQGRKGWACLECFDYDLCSSCYSRGRNPHSIKTRHKFKALRVGDG